MRRLPTLVLCCLLAGLACDKATPIAPSGATITLTISPTHIAADGQAAITAIVRKEDGNPVNPGTEVTFSTTLGEVEPRTAVTNDRGLAEATLQGTGEGGTATVTATSGAATDVSVDVRIGFVAASIVLDSNPSSLPLEGGTVDLIATVRDDQGQLIKDIAVNFSADTGTFESFGAVFTDEEGVARNRLIVTQSDLTVLEDFFFSVSAVAATEGGTLLEDITEIAVFGGVAFISLQATPSTVPEAGGSVLLLALVQDDIGEPVEGAGVNFGTEIGELDSAGGLVRSDRNGEAVDTLTVSAEDISSLTGDTFTVVAETVGAGGELLSSEFSVRIQPEAPVADFTFTTLTGCVVSFDASTSRGKPPLQYSWDFGDGGGGSGVRPPNHTYTGCTGAESFNVTLTVTNDVGSDDVTKVVTPTP